MFPGTNRTWTQDKGSPGKKSGREGGEGAKDYSLSIYSSLLKVGLNLIFLWPKSLALLSCWPLSGICRMRSSVQASKTSKRPQKSDAPWPPCLREEIFSLTGEYFFHMRPVLNMAETWYNSWLNPLLDQAEEAQYCQWTTVAIQSQSCVFQKSKAAQVIRSFRFLCWASLSYNYMFHRSRSPRKASRKISKIPFKVLDAPELQDDFYLNLVRSQTVKFQSNLFGANWTDWEN